MTILTNMTMALGRIRSAVRPAWVLASVLGGMLVALASAQPAAAAVSFGKSLLGGESSVRPTSLQFGPDGRLYVAQQNGLIYVYTVARSGPNAYAVIATETITQIASIPNHNDQGGSDGTSGRLVTGLLVTGTAATPVLYVTSSDPRIGAGESGADLNLDTNSGIVTQLVRSGAGWSKTDIVRGLPRSEENHASNGMALSPDGKTLYVAQGGNTNKGAPSANFANLPEYALSAAILSIDLTGSLPFDLPRKGGGGPFGGDDGAKQALPGGPVKVHAPGFRNPYDVLVTKAGKMYTIDNGGNAGWGDPLTSCNNNPVGQGNNVSEPDVLHHVTGPGYYGGHPNPERNECVFQTGLASQPYPKKTSIASFGPTSTNGIAEYTASNFGGEMKGDLLATSWNNTIQRIKLDAAGTAVSAKTALVNNAGAGGPLDVVAQGDADKFPGTVWYVDIFNGAIYVLEPTDSSGCDSSSPTGDPDSDGYSNQDEALNGTDPCSGADKPADFDGDKKSDRLDTDDDNDGLADKVDPFARDAANGLQTSIPVDYQWENDSPAAGGLLGLGFTGLMTNGTTDYLDQFDATKMTAGGAAGVTTIDEVSEGDAFGTSNTQEYGFQFGVNARPTVGKFVAHTRIVGPFKGITPADFQSMGLFVGTGDQDNYVKVIAGSNGGTVVQARKELSALSSPSSKVALTLPGPDYVDLYLEVDPRAATVQPSFTATTGSTTTVRTNVGGAQTVPAAWFTGATGLAVGILSTSSGAAPPFAATWDAIDVKPSGTNLPFGEDQPVTTPPVTTPPVTTPPVTTPPVTPPPVTERPDAPDTRRPVIRQAELTSTRFRSAGRGARFLSAVGTRVRFSLTEAASIAFKVQRRAGGRYKRVKGRKVVLRPAGKSSVRFTGRIGGRRLSPGRYRLVMVASDAAGNRSPVERLYFRIVR